MRATDAESDLRSAGNSGDAEFLQRFFKTGQGEYGEGDRFLGIRVPAVRKIARKYTGLPLEEVCKLLRSPYHESRLLALLILVRAYDKGDADQREEIFDTYLSHTRYINNWDLVDTSAEHIVGRHLMGGDISILRKMARSDVLWERRIAMLTTFHMIRKNEFDPAMEIAGILVDDTHDLIHKAVGWMLREVGKRDRETEEKFLKKHYRQMPRTMLRYAIERFPEDLRRAYLQGEIA